VVEQHAKTFATLKSSHSKKVSLEEVLNSKVVGKDCIEVITGLPIQHTIVSRVVNSQTLLRSKAILEHHSKKIPKICVQHYRKAEVQHSPIVEENFWIQCREMKEVEDLLPLTKEVVLSSECLEGCGIGSKGGGSMR